MAEMGVDDFDFRTVSRNWWMADYSYTVYFDFLLWKEFQTEGHIVYCGGRVDGFVFGNCNQSKFHLSFFTL